MSRTPYWFFTLNNPQINLDTHPANPFPDTKYLVYQLEQGTNGTFHFQGYVVFNQQKRFNWVKKALPNAHWQPRKGSHQQAKTYCTKEDTRIDGPWEFGDDSDIPNGQGGRTDLLTYKKAIEDGLSDKQLMDDYTIQSARFPKFANQVRLADKPPIKENMEVFLLWGPPGSGKSHWCYKQHPDLYALPVQQKGTLWFDTYAGQETLLIDEFEGEMALTTLLRILDVYPIMVPVKTGFVWLRATRIYITSNRLWNEWYDFTNREVKKKALERRFTQIIEVKPRQAPVRMPKYMTLENDTLEECAAPAAGLWPMA